MTAGHASHPSADALRAFEAGRLEDRLAEEIVSHLEGCPHCCEVAAGLPPDDFLARLREAHGGSATPMPGASLSGLAESVGGAGTAAGPRSAVPALPPELVNSREYEILRELGRGGMGVVYLARNVLTRRVEVLKVVTQALLDRPGAAERFLREIRAAARLSHDNVVRVHNALSRGELLVLVMEYVDGEDLARVVRRQGPLPVARACDYVRQAALGLQHAHEHGLVHRDVKPHNLILARVGAKEIVKVLDFGLAKATREGDADTGLTPVGNLLGTPDFIAPEQALDAAGADIRADIYSLGCTLYYLLSGAPPFRGKSLFEVLRGHVSLEAVALDQVRQDVPGELAAVVAKMMAKDSARRYRTPAEAAAALAPFVKTGDGEKWARAGKPGAAPRRRVLGAGVGAAMLLGLAALWASGVFRVPTAGGPSTGKEGEEAPAPDEARPVFLDATAYLPLGEHNRREVTDFAEVHAKSPEDVVRWANGLGTGYVPVALGDHATASPPQVHTIAVKLTNAPRAESVLVRLDVEEAGKAQFVPGHRDIQRLWVDIPKRGMHDLHHTADDGIAIFLWGVPNDLLPKFVADRRQEGIKPYLLIPCNRPNPNFTVSHWYSDYGRKKWRLETGLTRGQLAKFAEEAKANDLYLTLVTAYRDPAGNIRFGAIAWENPDGRDWEYKDEMTTAEYGAEVRRRKADGFRPVTVTSYDDPEHPKYAAAWVRYFYRPKPR